MGQPGALFASLGVTVFVLKVGGAVSYLSQVQVVGDVLGLFLNKRNTGGIFPGLIGF